MSEFASRDIKVFIEENYGDVYRYLYHKVHSRLDAQDLTQETFLRYARSVNRSELAIKGRPYLFTIARNIGVDYYRSKKPESTELTPELEETMCAHEPERDGFDEMVSSLPPDFKELLSLKYSQGFNNSEIAKITGTTRFTVRSKINKALSLLKKALQEEQQ